MKFFVYSLEGAGAALAWKMQEEGNDVRLFIEKSHVKSILSGMVKKVQSCEEGLSWWPDVVLFDGSKQGKLADSIRKRGFRVVGASEVCDVLELDRTFAMNVAKKMGIKVPDFEVFKNTEINDAIAFIESTGKRYVLKPHGNASLDLTYVAKDTDDMIQEITWAKEKGFLKSDFILQEFVDGLEISTEAWFSDGNVIPQLCNGTIEQKKFMAGNKGPNTGCESSVIWGYDSPESKIVKQTIGKMLPVFSEYKYCGPVDVNAIVKDGQAYFLEFTPRIGYSAIYGLAELITNDLGDFFYSLATRNVSKLSLSKLVSMAITMSIAPYPLDAESSFGREAFKLTKGKKIDGAPKDGFWPDDVSSNGQDLVTAGTTGVVCYVSATGKTVQEAEDAVYKKIDEMNVPDGQYRVDGACRAEKDIPALKEQGYDVPNIGPGEEDEDPETIEGEEGN